MFSFASNAFAPMRRSVPTFALAIAFLLFMALPVCAAESAPAKATPAEMKNTPVEPAVPQASGPATPVFVELEGTDTIGAKLSMQLQEIFNSGTLFHLTAKDEPKIRILISTKPEFASRPGVGSAYTVIWLYYERATAFNSYLTSEIGVVSAEDVPGLAMRIAERTTGIAAKYAYIFK